jgi:two-component system response regulator AtoC
MTKGTPVDLQSLVDTHEEPFMVINRDFRIVAVNGAFEKTYGIPRERATGMPCYKASHANDRPCYEFGEDCPHKKLYSGGGPHSCLHVHYDKDGRTHWVRVKAYPIRSSDGEVLLGEMVRELSSPEESRKNGVRMVGKSPEFLKVIEQLKIAAASDAPLLLTGETGTGKELAASFIHKNSKRRDMPFFTLDCTTFTEELFASEAFGHTRGAFTGSTGEKQGLFELADGGTIVLDEIGELSKPLQAKLLRVLESGEFRRVGGSRMLQTNARIICATNRSLKAAVQQHWFRQDLYYRIACLSVHMPSLRERLEDIPELANALLERISQTTQKNYRLTDGAISVLSKYNYPGNIRELRNVLSVAATHCGPEGTIDTQLVADLLHQNVHIHEFSAGKDVVSAPPAPKMADAGTTPSLSEMEAGHISGLLQRFAGNRREVAKALGISERTLYRKLKRYSLP